MFALAQRYWMMMAVLGLLGISIGSVTGIAQRAIGIDPMAPIEQLRETIGELVPRQSQRARVVRVIDGDTVVVKVDRKRKTLRIIGIDTPESVHPQKRVECYAKRASKVSRRRLLGKTVNLVYDVQQTDKYKRTLAYIELGRRDYGQWLLENGYARQLSIEPNTTRKKRYSESESTAKKQKRGLWGACY